MKGLKGVISWLSAFLFAVAVIAVYKTFDNFDSIWAFVGTILDILSPFVTGFGLAFLLFAPSRFLENKLAGAHNRFLRKGARPIAIAVVYLALLLIVAVILIFALPALARALIGFLKTLPDYYKTAMDWVEQYTRPGGVLENFDVPGKLQELYDNVLSKINMDTPSPPLFKGSPTSLPRCSTCLWPSSSRFICWPAGRRCSAPCAPCAACS